VSPLARYAKLSLLLSLGSNTPIGPGKPGVRRTTVPPQNGDVNAACNALRDGAQPAGMIPTN